MHPRSRTLSYQRPHVATEGSRRCPLPFKAPVCPPGLSSLTHHGCCWLISGHASPAPSGQPNTTSEESQLSEPGEETILRGSQSAF